VTVLVQELSTAPQAKGTPAFKLPAVEHCIQESRRRQTFEAITGAEADLAKHAASAMNEIPDLASFAPDGLLVVPPQVRASAIARRVTADLVKPIPGAQVIHEEQVDINTLDLYFRPVSVFEYEWAAKNKRVDEMHTGGKKFTDQFKSILTRDLLFDVTADAFGTIVPGGGIAVKLVKAVVDRRR
jgi:hypothetical protein